MKETIAMSTSSTSPSIHYAGIWRRLIAMTIDYMLVSLSMFLLLAVIAVAVPRVADLVDLSRFGWLTARHTLETLPTKTVVDGDKTETISEKIVETTVAGRWVYVHRATETSTHKSTDAPSKKPVTRYTSVRLDPGTHTEMNSISVWYYFWLPWLLYAVLLE
jgi:hypothetical protein